MSADRLWRLANPRTDRAPPSGRRTPHGYLGSDGAGVGAAAGGGSGRPCGSAGGPEAPARAARTSASTETAVSAGVEAPMSRPIGACSRASSSAVAPRSSRATVRRSCVRRDPIAPTYPAPRAQGGQHQLGVVPLVVRHHARPRRARPSDSDAEVPDRPVDDHLVGPRVPTRRRQHGARVAHRDAVPDGPRGGRERGGELERAVDHHAGGRGGDLDEHLDPAVRPGEPHDARCGVGQPGRRAARRTAASPRRRLARARRPRAGAGPPDRARARARAGRRRRSGPRRTRPRR